jgi:hypothetical protein
VRVRVRVRSGVFAGSVDAWIHRDAWVTFRQQLAALERTRQGEATLESMSPGDLRLRIGSLDRLGHMGVEGQMAEHSLGAGARQPQTMQLEFGPIDFDPTLLPELVRELTA